MSGSALMALSIALPAAGAALILLAGRWPNLRETVTLATAVGLLAIVAALCPQVLGGGRPSLVLIQILPGIPLMLQAEPLGMLFALVASSLWIVNSIFSIGYMRGNREAHQTRFYTFFAVALASTMGVAFAGNLITLFVFYEVLTLCTYPLVTHHGDQKALEGGRRYLGILLVTSIGMLLLAIVWTWAAAGRLDFVPGGILAGHIHGPATGLLLLLYMFGIGKAALMPVHRWLPSAMVAPTPVSALLHAVAVVKAGVFTVIKVIVYVFGLDLLRGGPGAQALLYVAAATILLASFIALRSDNLKRRLAYSTVSQLAYVVMAGAVLAPLSVAGAAVHIAAHAFGKITLFFAAGSIYTASHKTEVSQLNGIGRRMPWTMGAFAVGALSMVGVPPTAGFVSKWYMLMGALNAGQLVAVAVIVVSTLLNAAYFLPIVYAAFFRPEDEVSSSAGALNHGEAPLPIVIALTLTALGTLAIFFAPHLPLELAGQLVGIRP